MLSNDVRLDAFVRAVLRVALGCPFISVESFHFCGEVYPDAGLITHRVPEAQVQVVRKTAMVEVLAEVVCLPISSLFRY